MSYLILECGSAARGDTNSNSDRDLVCIWSGTAPNYAAIKEMHGEVIFYSVPSIIKMRNKGSLFLTHLDIDSRYLEGDKKLRCYFDGYRPLNKCLTDTILDSMRFIHKVRWYPDVLIGKLWLCDVLYVALRNFIYCKNAMDGYYIFGYESAVEKLNLSEDEFSMMMNVREGKYSYRRGDAQGKDNLNISDIEDVCRSVLGQSVSFMKGGTTDWKGIKRRDYWAERIIERAIINGEYEDEGFLDQLKDHSYNRVCIRSRTNKILQLKK